MSGHPHNSEITPLKRHPTLQPLSREHMSGLIQARNLITASASDEPARRHALAEFLRVWREEISDHFLDEERMLLPLTSDPALRDRLLREHAALRSIAHRCESNPAHADPATLRDLGALLHDHIRWEERIYFEALQKDHPEALAALHGDAHHIEQSRPGSRPRYKLDHHPTKDDRPPPPRA